MSQFYVLSFDNVFNYPWYADIELDIMELEAQLLYEQLYWDSISQYYE